MKIFMCIDYDNLSSIQKESGILNVAQRIIASISNSIESKTGSCEIRLYGGWYEDDNLTQASQQLSIAIQDAFPSIIRVQNKNDDVVKITTTAELALSLLEEPSHHLFNTFRKKRKPGNIKVVSQNSVGCNSNLCLIPLAKKLLKKGICPAVGCGSEGEQIIYRHEQKLVDTMLTCDLLYLSEHHNDVIVVVSSDDDFLPPIRSLLNKGKKIIRCHPKISINSKPVIVGRRVLMEMEV